MIGLHLLPAFDAHFLVDIKGTRCYIPIKA